MSRSFSTEDPARADQANGQSVDLKVDHGLAAEVASFHQLSPEFAVVESGSLPKRSRNQGKP